jgi:hypothetical protein
MTDATMSGLAHHLSRIRAALERHANDGKTGSAARPPGAAPEGAGGEESPVGLLCETFGLTGFERDVLLLCAGVELDGDFARLVASISGRPQPTFSLALAALDEPHWSALLPTGPLRYWRIVELGDGPGIVGSLRRIDERILHFLVGLQYVDERIAALTAVAVPPAELAPAKQEMAERIAAAWSGAEATQALPIVQLYGADPKARLALASYSSALVEAALLVLDSRDLPEDEEAFVRFERLWEREALLTGAARMIVCGSKEAPDSPRLRRIERLAESAAGAMVLSTQEPLTLPGRETISFELAPGD